MVLDFINQPYIYTGERRKLVVKMAGTMRGMSWRSCHWHALHELVIHLTNRSRHVHELFANTSWTGHDKVSCHKFWTFQNLLPDLARSHDAFKNSLQLVYALPRLNWWQCVPQSRASVRVPLQKRRQHHYASFTLLVVAWMNYRCLFLPQVESLLVSLFA